ncbi:MAG: DNA gyrase subunit A [bacterium]|nr:DNA gyrase subunit A [bacterium]
MTSDIQKINIEQEMRDAYLDYAMSVIVSRALPDARDGLKPVQRRIMYAMYDMGLRADTPYKKSARIVGEVLGKYHPHGDSAVYEAMVRMAQSFSLRYLLVNGQGNFGSIDGDGAAAMRYTEARLGQIGEELLLDINKDTVDFTENFDGSLEEPSVLPSSIPNLLVNGATGIAVGMSTSVPPHNLHEVCDALIYMLKNWDKYEEISVNDLMRFVKGPDFPTGGIVYRHKDGGEDGEDTLISAYATGHGKVTVRAKVHIEEMGRGKQRIVISELPYQVNKTSLIERIASLVRDGKLEGLADLRDESDRNGMRISIELQRGVEAGPVLANLFKLTPLQDTFSIHILALVDNQPRLLSLKQALKVYIDHRLEIIRRRSEFDLARAKERAHILEGLLKALDKIDRVIKIIRAAETAEMAREGLIEALKITAIQAQSILDMQLRRLASLERQKIQDEFTERMAIVEYLQGLLANPVQMREVVSDELASLKSSYGDNRRTFIADSLAGSTSIADLMIPEEQVWLTITSDGKVARTADNVAPKVGTSTKEPPRFILNATTSQILHLFTSTGKCATIPIQQITTAEDFADGASFTDLCSLPADSQLVAAVCLPNQVEHGYLFMATELGDVKRIRLADLPGMTSNVFVVMNVSAEDKMMQAFTTDGKQDILLTSNEAQSIRFKEDEVRPTGLPAGGMRGIKLGGQRTRVVGANIVRDNLYVFNITDDGMAKISAGEEYPQQGRAGGGVITMRLPKSSREITAVSVGRLDDTLIVLTNKGKAKLMRYSNAPLVKRGRNGEKDVISMTRQNEVVSAIVEYLPMYELAEADAE